MKKKSHELIIMRDWYIDTKHDEILDDGSYIVDNFKFVKQEIEDDKGLAKIKKGDCYEGTFAITFNPKLIDKYFPLLKLRKGWYRTFRLVRDKAGSITLIRSRSSHYQLMVKNRTTQEFCVDDFEYKAGLSTHNDIKVRIEIGTSGRIIDLAPPL
jgi:hypothetical protein